MAKIELKFGQKITKSNPGFSPRLNPVCQANNYSQQITDNEIH